MSENHFYDVVRALAKPLCHLIYPFRIHGVENIPQDGPCVLVINHVSMLDPIFVAVSTRRYIRYISKKELFDKKPLAWFFGHIGMFPVGRGETDMTAMRTMMGILKDGGCLGIFPQGHRHKQDDDRTMETGAAVVCLRAKAPVVPIHVKGPVKPFHRNEIRIGAPLHFERESVNEVNRQLIQSIWGESEN